MSTERQKTVNDAYRDGWERLYGQRWGIWVESPGIVPHWFNEGGQPFKGTLAEATAKIAATHCDDQRCCTPRRFAP